MSDAAGDWRRQLLESVRLEPEAGEPVNPLGWPGYSGAQAVRWGHAQLGQSRAVVAAWDFAVQGGSFGERDATAFLAAVDAATGAGVPLVSLLRSGGTRLQEGMAALVGMPRATLGVRRLAAAGVPHIAVADQPTTGGVWVTIGSRADIRAAVDTAVVGFAGPRVVEALTGAVPTKEGPQASHSARSAADAGLVDALLEPHAVRDWLLGVLAELTDGGWPEAGHADVAADTEASPIPAAGGWEQVQRARTTPRASGLDLLEQLVPAGQPLRGADATVAARIGRLAGGSGCVVGVAVAAERGGMPTVAGYRLLTRAAELAGRLRIPLVSLVDTPGADASPAQENDGMATAIGDAMDAVLGCTSPTVSVLHGEGGSGGALAAASTDRVLVTGDSYFAALGPEGAAVTLRRPADEAMRLMRVTPADLVALGFAARTVAAGAIVPAVAQAVHELVVLPPDERLAARDHCWSQPLPGHLPPLA